MILRQRTVLTLALRVVLVAIPAAIAAHYVFTHSMTARAVILFCTGQAGRCTFSETLDSRGVTSAQIEASERMRRSMSVADRDLAGFERWRTARGMFWMPLGSQTALHYDLGEQERQIYGLGKQGLMPGDIVLDCGANIGVYTREALSRGARLVVAIEPAPENLACLRRNMAQEIADGRVIVYPKGVWDREDTLRIRVDPHNSAADSFTRQPAGTVEGPQLPLTTIDRLVDELRLPRVDFIKMDIEGAEQRAIRGASRTIARYQPRMAICVYHQPDDPAMVPRLVRAVVPDYRVACRCFLHETSVGAEVMYFY